MDMEKKCCGECGAETWHNKLGGKNVGARCTKCAKPFGTGFKVVAHDSLNRLAKKGSK